MHHRAHSRGCIPPLLLHVIHPPPHTHPLFLTMLLSPLLFAPNPGFSDLEVRGALLDEVMLRPDAPALDMVVTYEARSLRWAGGGGGGCRVCVCTKGGGGGSGCRVCLHQGVWVPTGGAGGLQA